MTVAQAIAALTSFTANFDETGQTGSPVSSWALQSGSTDVTSMGQASSGLRPAASTVNGKAAPLFDGSDDVLTGFTNHMNTVLSTTAYYWAAVAKPGTISATDAADPRNDHAIFSDQSGFLWGTLLDISGTKYFAAGHRDSGNKWVLCVVPNPTLAHVFEVWFDGSAIRAAVDGVEGAGSGGGHVSPQTATTCGGMTGTGVRFGQNLSAYYSGELAQFIAAQHPQDATKRLNLRTALKAKYATP